MSRPGAAGLGRVLLTERIAVDLVAFALLTRTSILAFTAGFHGQELLGVALALVLVVGQSARS